MRSGYVPVGDIEGNLLPVLRAVLDTKLPKVQAQIGVWELEVRPGLYTVEQIGVDDWQYGFDAAVPRALRLRIKGFISVPVASDPTFELNLGLQFGLAPVSGGTGYPALFTLFALLTPGTRAKVEGIESATFAQMLLDGVVDAFEPDIKTNPELAGLPALALTRIPTGANQQAEGNLDFVDIMLMASGGLNLYVSPLPPVNAFGRAQVAKQQIAAFVNTLLGT